MRIKDIVIIGMLGALLVAAQVGLSFLPNIELVSLLIIIYTCILGKKTLYIIGTFILLEGFMFGFGLWWFNYLYIWVILYFLTRLLYKKENTPLKYALLSGSFGLAFGALCAIPFVFFVYQKNVLEFKLNFPIGYWIAGIPFDIIHGISNFLLALFLFRPLSNVLKLLISTYYANEKIDKF